MQAAKYSILVYWSQADNAFIAAVPDLPDIQASGSTYQEAITQAAQQIDALIKTATEQHQPLPAPQEQGISTHHYITSHPDILHGEPIIQGTRTPVRAIVENWRLGISPEEIPLHLPHLNLAQVFSALSYYLNHQAEINHYIEQNHIPEAKQFVLADLLAQITPDNIHDAVDTGDAVGNEAW